MVKGAWSDAVPLLDGVFLRRQWDTALTEGGAIFDAEQPELAQHRYALWRIWDTSKRPLVVMGLNPSKATHVLMDPTVTLDVRLAQRLDFGGLVKANLHSLRSTDPKALKRKVDGVADRSVTGGEINDQYLKWLCHPQHAGMVLVAWGSGGQYLDRGREVASMLVQIGVKLMALKVNDDGHPHHTLYLKKDLQPVPFSYDGTDPR
jgi:hypothetical protein